MKVVCINSDGWESETDKGKSNGPESGIEYEVLDQEDGFYELKEFPGVLFDKNEFVTSVEWTPMEEKVLDQIFSH